MSDRKSVLCVCVCVFVRRCAPAFPGGKSPMSKGVREYTATEYGSWNTWRSVYGMCKGSRAFRWYQGLGGVEHFAKGAEGTGMGYRGESVGYRESNGQRVGETAMPACLPACLPPSLPPSITPSL